MESIENLNLKAEDEIKKLLNCGLNFSYGFDWNNVDKFMICIEEEGYDMKTIISKLKKGEKLFFLINDGAVWNGRMGDKHKMFYDKSRDGSIYWKHDQGECVRIDSSMGSIKKWSNEIIEKFTVKKIIMKKINDLNVGSMFKIKRLVDRLFMKTTSLKMSEYFKHGVWTTPYLIGDLNDNEIEVVFETEPDEDVVEVFFKDYPKKLKK